METSYKSFIIFKYLYVQNTEILVIKLCNHNKHRKDMLFLRLRVGRPAFEDEDDVIGGRGDDRDEDEEEVPYPLLTLSYRVADPDPDSIGSVDPDPYSESGYGSRRAK